MLRLPAEIKVKTSKNWSNVLTKRIKIQHEKKPLSNLKRMQSVGFEQTSTEFIEIFVP